MPEKSKKSVKKKSKTTTPPVKKAPVTPIIVDTNQPIPDTPTAPEELKTPEPSELQTPAPSWNAPVETQPVVNTKDLQELNKYIKNESSEPAVDDELKKYLAPDAHLKSDTDQPTATSDKVEINSVDTATPQTPPQQPTTPQEDLNWDSLLSGGGNTGTMPQTPPTGSNNSSIDSGGSKQSNTSQNLGLPVNDEASNPQKMSTPGLIDTTMGDKSTANTQSNTMFPSTPTNDPVIIHSRYSGPEAPSSGGSKKVHIIYISIITLLLLLLGVSSFYSFKNLSLFAGTKEDTTLQTAVVAKKPTTQVASPSAALDKINKSEIKIRVLNGTRSSGVAASASSKLKALGYKIESTDNATSSAYLQTLVLVKESNKELTQVLIEDLKPQYSASFSGFLSESDPADAEIIIGKK